MTWTKERIHALLDSNPKAVLRACLAIYERQTADEQQTLSTQNRNGVGFGAFDAEFCSDIAQRAMKAQKRGWNFTLTAKQLAVLRNKMKHYHRQLCEIANEREAGAVLSSGNPIGDDIGNIEEARMVRAEIVAVDHRTAEERQFDAEIQRREALEEARRMRFKYEREMQAMGLRPGDYL